MPTIFSSDGLNLNVSGAQITNMGDANSPTDAVNYAKLQHFVPTGSVQMFAGNSPPNAWLICNGSAISRTNYANLYAVIGDMYIRIFEYLMQ